MRARFAGDAVSGTSDDVFGVNKIEKESLETRVDDFKRDPKNMEALTEFIDDVLQKAELEAVRRQQELQDENDSKNGKSSQQPKEKTRQSFAMPDFKNGKVVNRARGLVVRIFDAICNCANTAASGPTQRLKLRGKRSASASNGGGVNGANASEAALLDEKAEVKEKQKRQSNGGGASASGIGVGGGVRDKNLKEEESLTHK